jgi:hypothetical protein
VIELSKDNKQLAKELTSMREKQSLFEHRFQAIQGKGNNYIILIL